MQHQDWEDVTLSKGAGRGRGGGAASREAEIKAAERAGAKVVEQKKFAGGKNKAHAGPANARVLDQDTGDYHVDRVSHDFCRALQQARQAAKLTQAELAQRVNEKQSLINEYESGKAIPNPAVVAKLSKVLGAKLPRPAPKVKRPAEDGP